jgi:molybdate transport repressor ModE-like protein
MPRPPAPLPPAARPRATAYRIAPFDLQLLLSVLELGSITAAAQAVSLSLAAASARLQALEHAVGLPLLRRAKAGTTATEAGQALARQARRVLGELEALHVEMAGIGRGLRGTLRVLCNSSAMSEALPPRLGPFLRRYPDLDLDVQELPSDAVLDALRRGSADLGIVADYVDTSGLVVQPWLDDPLVALLPRGWLGGRQRRTLHFAELLDRPLVGLPRDRGLSRFLARQAGQAGRAPQHRVRLASFDALAPVVAAGVGAAVVPERATQRWQGQGGLVVRPLADAWARRRLLLCTSAESAGHAGLQALVAALLAR